MNQTSKCSQFLTVAEWTESDGRDPYSRTEIAKTRRWVSDCIREGKMIVKREPRKTIAGHMSPATVYAKTIATENSEDG